MTNQGRLLGGRVKTHQAPLECRSGLTTCHFKIQINIGNIFRFLQHIRKHYMERAVWGVRGSTINLVCSVLNGSDPHFLRVPCWKITLFVIVPVLGPLIALIICYNWLHRRLAGTVAREQTGPVSSGGRVSPEWETEG